MNSYHPDVSVVAPLSPAIERTKQILFRPFDLGRWLVIGFCAWLAFLGEGGGGGGNFNFPGGGRNFRRAFEEARDYVMSNLHWIIPLAIGLVVVGFMVWLVFTWLSSRGRFMFLPCIAGNVAEVRVPWFRFAEHGNSLFLFRIVLGLISLVMIAPVLVAGGLLVARMVARQAFLAGPIAGLIGLVLLLILIGVGFALVHKFTTDFVVPVMALRTGSCLAGWREVLALVMANKLAFVLYVLFQIALKLAIGIAVLAIILVTCCCAACFLIIPYVGTVLLLPVLVFERSYSLLYLRQFGPEYDVFSTAPAPIPTLRPLS
jgi:hypothetical protein